MEIENQCPYCDATDTNNFGQCISCNEQVDVSRETLSETV